MISVELFTPKGVSKGLYHYKWISDISIKCWKENINPDDGYVLTWNGIGWTCNCEGHMYRRACAHATYCPHNRLRKDRVSCDNLLVQAAKNAWVRLLDGRLVNCFDYFWKKN